MLPAKARQLGLIPEGINSWLYEINHPVSACLGLWQGELIRLGKVALNRNGSRGEIDVFPCKTT